VAETRLTLERVCALTGWTATNVRLLARTRGWQTRLPESRGRNGKQQKEYLLSDLPAAAQARFAEERRMNLAIIPAAPSTLPLFGSASAPEPAAPRIAIPEKLEGQAHARFEAIRPLLDFRKHRKGDRPAIRLANGKTVSTMDGMAEYIGAQQTPPVKKCTIWDWLRRFDTCGIAELADRPRKDKGKSRFWDQHPAGAAFLQQKYFNEGLMAKMSWEATCREWKRIGEKGSRPKYNTARIFLNEHPEPLKVLAREGKQAHWSKCSPSILRAKVPVMDWWMSDHRQLDVLNCNTLFPELPAGKAFRLWLTLIQDWGSRKIVGFCFAPTPSSRTINSALRMAILGHGMPRNFYWDNGKDYKKVRRDLELITLSQEASALLSRDCVSFGITSALPYHPRSKPIESHFSRWSKRYDVIWGSAYIGNKPGNCPEKARLAQKHHADFLKGKRADTPLPSDAEFIVATVQWIEEYNDTRLESLDHRTPNEMMEEQHPERNRPKVNPRLLDVLFSERTKRIVQKGGCVQLDGMRYEPTDESLFALDTRQGREVAILRDPYNLGEAIAADAETLQFVGELRMQQFVAQCPNGRITRDQINAGMRRERALRRGYAEWVAALSAIGTSRGWKTEREALMERATARTGTDGATAGAAPGTFRGQAQLPAPRRSADVQPTIGFDDVASSDGIWDEILAADGSILYKKTAPADSDEPSPLTVDEAVRKYLAEETEP
jgi:transposase InsO family protein